MRLITTTVLLLTLIQAVMAIQKYRMGREVPDELQKRIDDMVKDIKGGKDESHEDQHRNSLKIIKERSNASVKRLAQYYDGIKVYGSEVILQQFDNGDTRLGGDFIDKIDSDLGKIDPSLYDPQAKLRELEAKAKKPDHKIHNEEAHLIIYTDDKKTKATLAYYITFALEGPDRTVPVYVIDPKTGEQLMFYDNHQTGGGGFA